MGDERCFVNHAWRRGAFFTLSSTGVWPMRETWTFHSAGQLLFGRNAASQLGEVALGLRAKRILIATDPMLAKAGLVARIREPLERANLALEVFTGGEPEPSFRAADACIEMARQ